jgi:hypothetical protein
VEAWSGGVLNTVGVTYQGAFIPGTFLVWFGGGHSDYWGNEVYCYGPLESATPVCRRLNDPTNPPYTTNAAPWRDANGYPPSRHTYDTLQYDPAENAMVCMYAPGFGPAAYAGQASDVFQFNIDPQAANPWRTNDNGFPHSGSGGGIDAKSARNPLTRKMWLMGHGNSTPLACYDEVTRIWTSNTVSISGAAGADSKAAIMPSANLFVFRDGDGTVKVVNLATPTVAPFTPTITNPGNAAPPNTLNAPNADWTIEWDDARSRFVCYGATGKAIYFLTPGANPYAGGDPWVWTTYTPPTGATPTNTIGRGMYGRFRVVNGALDGLIMLTTSSAPIAFFAFS